MVLNYFHGIFASFPYFILNLSILPFPEFGSPSAVSTLNGLSASSLVS